MASLERERRGAKRLKGKGKLVGNRGGGKTKKKGVWGRRDLDWGGVGGRRKN